MAIVVDASIAAAWVISDEQSSATDALLDLVETGGGRVPDLFWHEIRNILLKVERRGRSAAGAPEAALLRLRRLTLIVVANRRDATVLALARDHQLTPYDAAYLDVAVRLSLPLATADRRLAGAAHAAGVAILGPYATPSP